jgi:hypothetical protein
MTTNAAVLAILLLTLMAVSRFGANVTTIYGLRITAFGYDEVRPIGCEYDWFAEKVAPPFRATNPTAAARQAVHGWRYAC